jgi:hypothetical protein
MSCWTISESSAGPIAKSMKSTPIATVIRNLIDGQYNNSVRIVCFNTAEGWARDVTEDMAREIQDRTASKGEPISPGLRDFID